MELGGRSSPLMMERLVLLSLLFVFLQTVYSQSQPWIGNLSVYEIASFKNPVQVKQLVKTQLDHFSVHPETGDVYVGAANYVYRLDEKLVQVVNISTATGVGEEYVNYNKILVLQGGRLIACGSERNSRMGIRWCASRNEDDLMEDGSTGQNYFEVAAFGNYTTESIVAPDSTSDLRLYVATAYCQEGCQTWSVPPISRRFLIAGDGFMFAHPDDDIIKLDRSNVDALFPISYVSSFVWKEFTYFVSFRKEDTGKNAHVSKISRVCQDSDDLNSYTEILIQCDSMYSLVQAAHVGPAGPYLNQSLSLNADDGVLYAVFAKNAADPGKTDVPQPMKGSALCMYKMSDIEAAFEAAVEGCLTGDGGYTAGYLENSHCTGISLPPIDSELYCNARNYTYADGFTPVVSTALLELPDLLTSSIATSIELNHTVAFIGTTEGQLLKVHVESRYSARLYEQIQTPLDDDLKGFTTNPVKRDSKINDTTGELYLLTEQKLIKMRVENCGQYTTCETCIGTDAGRDGDPYCGWCALQRQCTRYHECPLQDVPFRWLSYNDPQCIEITDIAPYDSHLFSVAEQQITLTVQQLPDLLSGQQYICHFDDVFSNPADKSGDTIQCMTPPSNLIPEIMNGEDHSSMLLSVESTETKVNFVDREFTFYDCSTYKSCVSCAGSRWACDWCVFENRCTHESTSCSGQNAEIVTGLNNKDSNMQGPDSCPQLQVQEGEILVPTGVDRRIIFKTDNLPNPQQIKSYQCILNIEGGKQSATATRKNDTVTCEDYLFAYTADEQELNVSLTVEWTDKNGQVHLLDDRHGFKVTLYKCGSQRPDCSRCVSEVTTREGLGCVWCDGTCAVIDSAVCLMTNSMVTRDNGLNCPVPVILEIFPLAGPVNGNTILTLNGTDFGQRFSDIQGVTVGGRVCGLVGLELYYNSGSSVTCLTRNNPDDQTPQELIVIVTGLNGDRQLSTGDVTFEYKNPVLKDFNPKAGPQSGGTLVTIFGESLDVGRTIDLAIGNAPCLLDRDQVNNNNLTCLTSRVNELSSRNISIIFDGAVKFTEGDYTYAEDPTVDKILPTKSILAGGREITVYGSGFSIIQKPQILIAIENESFQMDCRVETDAEMICVTPAINIPDVTSTDSSSLMITTGFIMDGVEGLRRWCLDQMMGCKPMEYVQNPVYYTFDHPIYGNSDGVGMKDGSKLQILGERIDFAITGEEITVYIGQELCTDVRVGSANVYCTLPQQQPAPGDNLGMNTSRNLPIVRVVHGKSVTFDIGYFSYGSTMQTTLIIVFVVCGIVLVCFLILVFVLYKKANKETDAVNRTHANISDMQQRFPDCF